MKSHYQELFKRYGDDAKSLHWTDRKTQFARFAVLAGISESLGSVVDVGCGLGHLYEHLLGRGFGGNYLGLDFVDEFVDAAAKKYEKDPRASFKKFDLSKDAVPSGYDYALLSGVFNYRMDDNFGFMTRAVEKMFAAAGKGAAFNVMSTYVDYQDPQLYYSDPREMLHFCKSLTRRVVLRHDYLVKEGSIPYEYTIYLYK